MLQNMWAQISTPLCACSLPYCIMSWEPKGMEYCSIVYIGLGCGSTSDLIELYSFVVASGRVSRCTDILL